MPRQRNHAKKILDWEELEQAPNTHGAFSFLKTAAEIVSIRRDDVVLESRPHGKTITQSRASTTAVGELSVDERQSETVKRERPGPRLCKLAQDGHSLGEAALYQMLWSRAVPETDETRVISAGWRTMRRFCGMTDKNCKRNTTGLINKFSIELIGAEDVHRRTGRTYRVYSYASILKRRRAAGLQWVSRDKSRRFVQENGSPLDHSALKICQVDDSTTVVDPSAGNPTTVAYTTTGTMVDMTPGTGVATTPPLGSLLGIQERNKSSSSKDVLLIIEALAQEAFVTDEQAALQLLQTCQNLCPDATADEVVGIIREKGAVMQARRDVRNPIGFLLTSVASVFQGVGIRSYRRNLAAAAAFAERQSREETRKENEMREWLLSERDRLVRILDDNEESDRRKDSARTMLAEVEAALNRS